MCENIKLTQLINSEKEIIIQLTSVGLHFEKMCVRRWVAKSWKLEVLQTE